MAVTLAVAAGLINAGVVLLQLTFPLLVVFLLVALLPPENNAVTWSAVGRQMQGSFWPLILSADSTTSTKVRIRVLVLSAVSTLGLLLLAAAAIVAPLGLYESVTAGSSRNVTFIYAKDPSPIGQATAPRDEYRTSRLCPGFALYYNCPGQDHGFSFFSNTSGTFVQSQNNQAYTSSVPPKNLSEVFGSGRTGNLSTVASALDLQYRSFVRLSPLEDNTRVPATRLKMRIDQGRPRSVGRFFMFQSYLLADDYVVVDGLVADMKNGGIGFRNHTIPQNIDQGAEWTESLLWVEPESICVDTNLTYQWTMSTNSSGSTVPQIVDNGGFAQLPIDDGVLDLSETQSDPKLLARALKGALLFNENLMRYLNTSRNASAVGRGHRLPSRLANKQGQLNIDRFGGDASSFTLLGDPMLGLKIINDTYPYHSIFPLIQGIERDDVTNLSRITADGGILLGMPVGSDGSFIYRDIPGVIWRAPLYSCVTTVKAYIKDVTFSMNGTTSLQSLMVKHASPRKYPSDSKLPLWAVEDTGFNVSNISPLWGFVDDKYEDTSKLGTVRKDTLYLPASRTQYLSRVTSINLIQDDAWAAGAPQAALGMAYGCAVGGHWCLDSLPDYTGRTSYPVSLKWRELSESPSTSGRIINMIYTDIMVNLVTSSRSKLTIAGTDFTNSGAVSDIPSINSPAILSSTVIRYRSYFAVPAIIFLACYAIVLVAFFFLLCTRQVTFSMLKSLANQTAVGRAITIERFDDKHGVRTMSTRTWIEIHGDATLPLSKNLEFTRLSTNIQEEERIANDIDYFTQWVPKMDTK